MCERELETEKNCNILTPTLMAISISFPFSSVAQPEARGPSSLLDAGFLYRILSPTGLVSKLVYKITDFLSSPSYKIVQSSTQYLPITGHRDVSLPLSLEWHVWLSSSGKKTVMQFTGHSLPVHQSMTVPSDFTLSHIVSQARLRDFFP